MPSHSALRETEIVDEESDKIKHVVTLANANEIEAADAPTKVDGEWRVILLLYSIVIVDAMSVTVFVPLLPDMLRRKFDVPEEDIGDYVGYFTSSRMLFSFFSSFFIGHASDEYGRKPFLVFGLCVSLAATLLIVSVPSYWYALAISATAGVLTSNIGLTRAALSDVARGETRSVAFAYLGASFATSRAVSSGISALASSADSNRPYLPPALIAASLVTVILVVIVIFLPETHPTDRSVLELFAWLRPRRYKGLHDEVEMTARPVVNDDPGAAAASLEDGSEDRASGEQRGCATSQDTDTKRIGLYQRMRLLFSDPVIRKLFVIQCLGSFGNGSMLVAMLLYFTLPVENHGLGLDVESMGLSYTAFGLCGVLFQLVFFKRIVRRWGLLGTFRRGCFLIAICSAMVPSLAVWGAELRWVLLGFLAAGFQTALPVVSAMVSNAARSGMIGLTQGTAASFSMLLRALGPLTCGMVFSWSVQLSVPYVEFWLLSLCYFAALATSIGLSHDACEPSQ